MARDCLNLHTFGPLVEAKLLLRYKRFLADFELGDGRRVTAHCPNPGRMTSILEHCSTALLTHLPPDPKRKLQYRWELASLPHTGVIVNTQLANKVAAALLSQASGLEEKLEFGKIVEVQPEATVESTLGGTRSRFDFALTNDQNERMYLEVKQVTLRVDDQDGVARAAFPDAVSARGARHLDELAHLHRGGTRTALLYVVGRDDVAAVRPAGEVDPTYREAFGRALESGVQVTAARLRVSREGLALAGWLPVLH